MGSGTSRGKRVAPECERDTDPAQPEQSGGSDFSQVEEDGPEDPDRSDKKTCSKKSFIRSKAYGLCHFGQGNPGGDVSPDPGLPAPGGAAGPRVDVNTDDPGPNCTHRSHTDSSPQSFLTRRALTEAVPSSEKQQTFGSCQSSSITTPVTQYDGSEEELMDSIEREFS